MFILREAGDRYDAVAMPKAPPPPPPLDVLPDSLRLLAAKGEPRRFRKGQLVIEEGTHGDTIFIILGGRLRAFSRSDGRNDREITYGVYGAGEYVGEMSLDGGPRSASVEAVEASDCVMVTRVTLQRHIAEHPDFAFELLGKVIRRARAATLSARQMALNDAYGRMKALLEPLITADASGARFVAEPLTHRSIAARIGSSREMVSRLLRDLEAGGYVRAAGRRIVVLKALPARW